MGGSFGEGTVVWSFWDVNTSGQTSSSGGTGKTTAEMKMKVTFTDSGWDFVGETINGPNDVWTIDEDVNYPELVWPLVNLVSSRYPLGWYEVDFVDFAAMAKWWGNKNCADNNDCNKADFDFSNTVDFKDLAVMCNYWLEGNLSPCNGDGYCQLWEDRSSCPDCQCNNDWNCDWWEGPDCPDCQW